LLLLLLLLSAPVTLRAKELRWLAAAAAAVYTFIFIFGVKRAWRTKRDSTVIILIFEIVIRGVVLSPLTTRDFNPK
jgi:hypothetical protein